MARKVEGKRVLITGASEGIGRAAARAFAAKGALVLAVARSRERLETLCAEVGGPSRAVPMVADVADGASMEAASRRILNEHGAPDVIVANAGIGLDALVEETTDAAIREIFEVNVFGVLRTVRPFLRGMAERGSGRILVVSSVLGKRGVPHSGAYSASKFALHGLADALRGELLSTGVTVGLVCPSTTESEFSRRVLRIGPSQRHYRLARHSAESVARAIVRMAASRRREVVLSPEGKLMAALNAVAPQLLDRVLARALSRRG